MFISRNRCTRRFGRFDMLEIRKFSRRRRLTLEELRRRRRKRILEPDRNPSLHSDIHYVFVDAGWFSNGFLVLGCIIKYSITMWLFQRATLKFGWNLSLLL